MASSHSDTDVFSSPLPYIIPHILANVTDRTPLFVAFQGPQGAGKTYLSSLLHRTLTSPPHSFSVAVLSIDDLYLPHSSLVALADAHPLNALLKGRGLPGTHDVPLGIKVLSELKNLNKRLPGGTPGQVTLPSFNKSLYDGEGDRSSSGVVVAGPLDIVILEGWCTGFCPITNEELEKRWEESNTHGVGDLGYNIGEKWRIEDIREVNQRLREYVELWTFFDIFIQIKPVQESPYSFIYKWRLEQEHYMKANNGGKGMTDDAVGRFVDRYIPGYVFFADGVTRGLHPSLAPPQMRNNPPWLGKGLFITIGGGREVVEVGNF